MVEKINVGDNSIDSKNINPNRRAIHIWNTTLSSMPINTPVETHKSQEVINLPKKLITI
jgi:hypothetical protein